MKGISECHENKLNYIVCVLAAAARTTIENEQKKYESN